MDSINLSEPQRIPLHCRSTASNTSPAQCGCCGLKNYAQTVPQAYYFSALYPGISKCKHCQGDGDEKFPTQQQFFTGLPSFLPPFFYNNAIPSNSCCSQNHLNDSTTSEQQNQPPNESGKIPLFQSECQKEKCGIRTNTKTEEIKKSNSVFDPEGQLLGFPFLISNPPDPQFNSLFQRCDCGDFISWPCNSFVLPVLSYCVFWNSQKSTFGSLSGNYSGISPATVCKKNNENLVNQKHLSSDTDKEIPPKYLNKDFNNNSTESADSGKEQCLGVIKINEWQKTEQPNINQNDPDSLRSPAFSLSNFSTENNIEQKCNIDRNLINDSDIHKGKDDEEEDTETCDSLGRERSDECLKLGEKDLSNLRTNLYFSNEPQDTLNENESQSTSASESLSDLKGSRKNGTSATDISSSDTDVNPSDISGEGEKAFHSRISNRNTQEKNSDNEYERKTPDMKPTYIKKPISIKKFIKNFTMTDHTNSIHEAQNSTAAAGDLGGDNCVGYKVNIIKSFEEDQQYKILQETQTEENFQSKVFFRKGLSNLEDSQPQSYCEKTTVKNLKSPRIFKSGIAKLSSSAKLKESKGDAVKKIINYNKELSQKEPSVIKRKHSCFPADNTTGFIELGSKIQKTKNCGMVQLQNKGPEKQYKASCSGSEALKKEEKTLKVKSKADKINSQKLSKIIRKN